MNTKPVAKSLTRKETSMHDMEVSISKMEMLFDQIRTSLKAGKALPPGVTRKLMIEARLVDDSFNRLCPGQDESAAVYERDCAKIQVAVDDYIAQYLKDNDEDVSHMLVVGVQQKEDLVDVRFSWSETNQVGTRRAVEVQIPRVALDYVDLRESIEDHVRYLDDDLNQSPDEDYGESVSSSFSMDD